MNEEEFQATLQGLHSGSSRLVSLIEDFLLLSRLRTGATARERAQVPPLPLRADLVVRKVASDFHDQAADRHVSLSVDCATPQSTVAISTDYMAGIVHRLLDNAIRFSKSDGGKVLVTTSQERNHWVLRITDDGIGIPQEALAWVFNAFQQVDRAMMEQQGIGVGLAIVQGLVDTHGGYVEVASSPGKGSTFSVWLPLSA
jgi:two-component system sensor histidine kinase VicK